MNFLEALKKNANKTYTENGALTNRSTFSECLDLFYMAGALRLQSSDFIENLVKRAFAEDKDTTMKIVFYARDIREGLGERRFFRIAIRALANTDINSVRKNLKFIPEYGRWDDILELYKIDGLKQDVIDIIKEQLNSDIENMKNENEISLLAKWLPSVNTSSKESVKLAKELAVKLGMTEKIYRQTLSSLRKYIDILETRLCKKDYTFDYSKQPSNAMLKYRKAFLRNDIKRYQQFLDSVSRGEQKLNTGTLYPYNIVSKAFYELSDDERKSLDITWNSLGNTENSQNAIAVIDGSGSMYSNYRLTISPIAVALSLGIYFAEHNKGIFKNHFITFSMNPKLVEIKGRDIYEKVRYTSSFNEVANTNIQGVFDLILDTAVKNKIPSEEMPERIYIISDMEFDRCAYMGDSKITNFDLAKKKFKKKGYNLPTVIFWNVNAHSMQVPVTMHESGTVLVSGSSPKLFDMVQSGDIDPYYMMISVISSERYKKITA